MLYLKRLVSTGMKRNKHLLLPFVNEQLNTEKVESIINQHLFTEITPLRDDVVAAMLNKPKLMQRKKLAQRALDKIMRFIETFLIDAPD